MQQGLSDPGRHVDLKPPASTVGIIGWIKSNLFNNRFNAFLTIFIVFCLYKKIGRAHV